MQPVLFVVPGLALPVPAYACLVLVALFLGFAWIAALARREPPPAEAFGSIFVVAFVLGLVVARAWFVLVHGSLAPPGSLPPGELAFGPGLLAAGATSLVLVAARARAGQRRVAVARWLDVVSPALALTWGLERLGAFFAGTGFGRVASGLAIAVRFPRGSPAFMEHRRELALLLPEGATASLPVHPVQLYGVGLAIGAAVLGRVLWRRRSAPGQVAAGLALYGITAHAFVEEWFRADAGPPVVGPFDRFQLASLVAVIMGIVWIRVSRRRAAAFGGREQVNVSEHRHWPKGGSRSRTRGSRP